MREENLIEEIIRQAESEEGQRMADETLSRLKRGVPGADRMVTELREQDIMKVLKASYIAERFFGKSRSWICHKLNHDIRNGKPDDFSPEEKQTLKAALDTIAQEIQTLSDSL